MQDEDKVKWKGRREQAGKENKKQKERLRRKYRRTLNVCRRLHRLTETAYRFTAKGVLVVYVPIRPVTVPIQSVTVHLARTGFQDCVVY